MARSKKTQPAKAPVNLPAAVIENAGKVVEQPITETLEKNYMPYAMSVIVSRAIPEIDGFKPSHRKLLYTMYKMGLLSGGRTKSANVVGQTMRLNPHGDAAIYETMVRLSRGYEALLYPYVDSKGNFGKIYSRDMAYAASRYTEVRLDKICEEVFWGIDRDTVDFADNYDGTMKEPVLLPVTFPTILAGANTGIAVGMASSICSFNLKELCDTTVALIRDPSHDPLSTMPAPDFPGGGTILYDAAAMAEIYRTGRGSFKVRAAYTYQKDSNCIEVTEIPYTTTTEAIIERIVDAVKQGRIREISDVRDETDLQGLKIAIDLKRGADPDKLMQKLYRATPLEDSFACNFNVLIGSTPRVMGVTELLGEWIRFRTGCVRRGVSYELERKKERLHLMRGLEKILLDIDRAVKIVRETEEEREVIPNLMIGFGIDKIQAEYVAEIRLRHLNREYILNRTREIDALLRDIAEMEGILASPAKVKNLIVADLKRVSESYGGGRKTRLTAGEVIEAEPEEDLPDYPVNLFFTAEGYFKKITPLSWRLGGEHKLKEDDRIVTTYAEISNRAHLLFFSSAGQCYKAQASDFDDQKASVMGDYIPAKLGFDPGESAIAMVATDDFKGNMLFFFENGKAAKVPLSAYATKTRRRKLTGAYSTASPLAALFHEDGPRDYGLRSDAEKLLVISSAKVPQKATRDSQGVAVMALRGKAKLKAVLAGDHLPADTARYRSRNIPAAGAAIDPKDVAEQLEL